MKHNTTIMFVEASNDMLPWFKRAQEFGYRCVVCGTDKSKEMARDADAYYDMPYSDRNGCIAIAEREKVDGVIGGGDQSALTAAYVAKALSLPGNDPKGMERMMNKQEFRELQKELGLAHPEFVYASELNSFIEKVRGMTFPIIVKPGQMSSSRGVKVFNSFDHNSLAEHFIYCRGLSYNDVVCAEQYFEIPERVVYEFNPFVNGVQRIWSGNMINIHSRYCPEVPSGDSWPMFISPELCEKAEHDILKVLKVTGYMFGEVDVESFFTRDGKFVILEINPRRCGGGVQKFIKYAYELDYIGMLVSLAVGDSFFWDEQFKKTDCQVKPISAFAVYSSSARVFNDIEVDEELKPYLYETYLCADKGSTTRACQNYHDKIGTVVFHFPSTDIQKKYIYRMEDFVRVI